MGLVNFWTFWAFWILSASCIFKPPKPLSRRKCFGYREIVTHKSIMWRARFRFLHSKIITGTISVLPPNFFLSMQKKWNTHFHLYSRINYEWVTRATHYSDIFDIYTFILLASWKCIFDIVEKHFSLFCLFLLVFGVGEGWGEGRV